MPNIGSLMYIFSFLWYYGSYVLLLIHMAFSILHVTGNNWNLSHTAIAGMRFFVRISNKSRKSCFLMRPMSLSSISNLMLLLSFFESSQSNLCSDPRDRSTGMAVYDAGIASEDYGGCSHEEAAR